MARYPVAVVGALATAVFEGSDIRTALRVGGHDGAICRWEGVGPIQPSSRRVGYVQIAYNEQTCEELVLRLST